MDSANNVVARYVYGNKANVPEYIVKGDTTYKVISDHLGSVRMLVNTSNGNIAQQINYDAFGNVTYAQNETEFFDFTFASGLYDNDTKLIRFGARDYNPTLGRWISKDPIGFGGGVSNLYEYCVNDPVNFVDPKGLQNLKALIEKIRPLLKVTKNLSDAREKEYNRGNDFLDALEKYNKSNKAPYSAEVKLQFAQTLLDGTKVDILGKLFAYLEFLGVEAAVPVGIIDAIDQIEEAKDLCGIK